MSPNRSAVGVRRVRGIPLQQRGVFFGASEGEADIERF
jgi:hypothetical protein